MLRSGLERRGLLLFRYDPPVVQGPAARKVTAAAEEMRQQDQPAQQGPKPAGREPGEHIVAPPDRLGPPHLELIHREPNRAPNRAIETHAALELLKQGRKLSTAGSLGQIDHSRRRERVGCLRSRRWSAQGSIQLIEVGNAPPEHRQIQVQLLQPVELPSRPGRVPFIKPQWKPGTHRVVEGEVGELVAQDGECTRAPRPHHDRSRSGIREPSRPAGKPAARQRVEIATGREDDEPERPGRLPSKARPCHRSARDLGEREGEIHLLGPSHRRDLPDLDSARLLLMDRGGEGES